MFSMKTVKKLKFFLKGVILGKHSFIKKLNCLVFIDVVFGFVVLLWCGDGYSCSRRYRAGYPDVSADDHIVADDGFAAKKRCAAIDDDVVADSGVAFSAFYDVSFLVFGEAERAKRYALVEFHVIADFGCLTYDYACAVVDEEVIAYFCTWVNVNSS